MATGKQWLVRGLWASLIGAPLLAGGLYLFNPHNANSQDPRLRILGVAPVRIGGNDMLPTLREGHVVFVHAVASGQPDLARGDIVTFRPAHAPEHMWVKRMIALPGDTLSIDAGQLTINGQPVEEPYLRAENAQQDFSRTVAAITIPAGHYYLMGDNRDNSEDSRFNGPVPAQALVGRVMSGQ